MSKTKQHHHDQIEKGMRESQATGIALIPLDDLKLFLQYLKHQEYDIDIIDNDTLHQAYAIFCDIVEMVKSGPDKPKQKPVWLTEENTAL